MSEPSASAPPEEQATPVPGGKASHLARSTVAMTILTGISRVTGLARIVIVGAVIGDTFLGNTYQTTNTVPNILFELMAAGTFQAVLIPALVRFRDRGEDAEGERVVGSVFGIALAALGAVALAAMLVSPLISRGLFSGSDPSVRADQVRLGTIFLLIFLPQVAMYAAGMVATGVLNAHDRFAVPAIAPAVNNVIVSTAYIAFWVARDGAPPSLDLSPLEIALLAGGTTAGVVGFCGLPLLALRRTSFRLRPRFDRHDPEVRRILKMGAWTAGLLASTQLLILVELLFANQVKGGVVALQIGWTFFLLPYALFAQPVLTALFPTMSRHVARGETDALSRSMESGTELICMFVVPAAITFVAVAPALCRGVLFGEISPSGAAAIARVVVAFAPGVIGYGLLLFYARVQYARSDARLPTLVTLGAAVVAGTGMAITDGFVATEWKVPVLAGWHALGYTLATVAMVLLIRRGLPDGARPALLRRLRPQALAVVPVAVVAVVVGRQVPLDSRPVALAGAAAVGLGVLAAYLALTALAGGPRPTRLVALLRGGGT